MFSSRRLWLRFALGMTVLVIGVFGMTSYTLWLMRGDAINNSLQVSALLAHSFETFLTQSLNTTAQSVSTLVTPERMAAHEPGIGADLNQFLQAAPHLRSLSVIDAQDRIVASSNVANVGRVVATADYFPVTLGAQSVLRIGARWVGRDFAQDQSGLNALSADRRPGFLPVLMALQDAPNLRLLAAINPDYFVNYMSQQLGPETGYVAVLRLDGVLLMSTDRATSAPGNSGTALAPALWQVHEFGQFEHHDGQALLTAFRVSNLYPFVMVTHLNRDVALQHWQNQAQAIVAMVVAALLLVGLTGAGYCQRYALSIRQRQESERLQRINAAQVFTHAREGIIISAADARIIDVNEAFTHITGYSREEVLGKNPHLLSSGRQDQAFYDNFWRELRDLGYWHGEISNRKKNGEVFVELLTVSRVADSQGKVQQYVALFSDITTLKAYQAQLEHKAHYDALTQLPNRILMADRLQQAVAQAQRRKLLLGVVFIDLDGFKAINDRYGHEAGDEVLIVVSTRMRHVLRDGDTLARNGGDEFVALLVDLQDASHAQPLLQRLIEAAAQPIAWGELTLQVSASIGVSFYPQAEPQTAEQLLHQADLAMYHAKLAGKNSFHYFDASELHAASDANSRCE